MKLIENGILSDPEWEFNYQACYNQSEKHQILSLEEFLSDPESISAIVIGADINLAELEPFLKELKLIVLQFESFTDGRGYSIAWQLRNSLGFGGKIWTTGYLIADQYAYAVQCGIDGVLIDEKLLKRQPVEHWREALFDAPNPYRYQDDIKAVGNTNLWNSHHQVNETLITKLNSIAASLNTEQLFEYIFNKADLGRIALVSSFGTESAVLLHLLSKYSPNTAVLFLDTGKLFSETLNYQKQLTARLQLSNVKILHPDSAALTDRDQNGDLWQFDNSACCQLRKVEPLQNALAGFDTWISGRKSYQSELRSSLEIYELAGNQIKVNPLAHWSHKQLLDHLKCYKLPAHPLAVKGYKSVGCAPCTSPVSVGEDIRSGRWRGQNKTECGIHFINTTSEESTIDSLQIV